MQKKEVLIEKISQIAEDFEKSGGGAFVIPLEEYVELRKKAD